MVVRRHHRDHKAATKGGRLAAACIAVVASRCSLPPSLFTAASHLVPSFLEREATLHFNASSVVWPAVASLAPAAGLGPAEDTQRGALLIASSSAVHLLRRRPLAAGSGGVASGREPALSYTSQVGGFDVIL